MTIDEFNRRHSEVCSTYDIAIEENSDFMVTGANYYKKDIDDKENEWSKLFLRGTGIVFEKGEVTGDPEGYLELLEKELKEEFKQ